MARNKKILTLINFWCLSCPLRLRVRVHFRLFLSSTIFAKMERDRLLLELLLPYTHLMKVGNKELSKKITLAFNEWFKLPDNVCNKIIDSVDMLQNGSLLIDDIQDNTLVRRGVPAAHCVYGVPLTLNTSIHIITLVLQELLLLGTSMAPKIFCEGFLEVIRGQGIELYWRDNFICPTEEQYDEINRKKTGHMYLICIRLMHLFSTNKTDYTDLVLTIGLYYQLRDDYCNLIQPEALDDWPTNEDNKPKIFCEDLSEGKFSLPIIHAAGTSDGDGVLHILRQRTRDVSLKKFCVSELQRLGSLEYTRNRLISLDKHIRDEINRFGGNSNLTSVMDDMKSWV
ncbi:geranylgeranyl pyrophosphate synthase-like [Pieris brassicae]|uniref:geranylgeranyl pyrophosphate synthase-like n=1 Tax=Pieris brassicae TaxID=7116 RepID=UPI001E65FBB1|nr:geranylgeranyl pyrophosphate synthase-like [Pieris brassicae]